MRHTAKTWRDLPYSGPVVLILGTLLATLFIIAFDRSVVALVNPGLIYLPVIAMLAYHWKWPLALIASILQLFCVYFFFLMPANTFKPLDGSSIAQLIVLAAAMGFVLAIVQLAVHGRGNAEHAAGRFAALNRIGLALASELDETRLLHLIAETARDLTGAGFAAFTLRPVNEMGEPAVPSEGYLFHLAAVVGVTAEQEEWFRHVSLGGEGLLAPIFHHGIPVRENFARPPSTEMLRDRPRLNMLTGAWQKRACVQWACHEGILSCAAFLARRCSTARAMCAVGCYWDIQSQIDLARKTRRC